MNNNTTTYLVKLQPLAPFFFGGEQGETADYYLKGNYIPQQTALLGLIRHQLLIQNGLLPDGKISNKEKAAILIGSESFQYNKAHQNFGVIQELSECFIALTSKIKGEDFCTYLYHAAPPGFVTEAADVNGCLIFPDYKPKEDYLQNFRLLKPSPLCRISFTINEIIDAIERPGVDKNYYGEPKEDGYYKQVWLTMKPDFTFAVYLILENFYNNDEQVIFKDTIVSFGKESTPFKMEVEKPTSIHDAIEHPGSDQNALYLTSDTYLPEDIAGDCDLAVTDTVPFRNVVNYVSQEKEDYFNRKPTEIPCSKRLQLYKRGSFFYTNNIENLAKKISGQHSFAKIGYNKFQFTSINIIS